MKYFYCFFLKQSRLAKCLKTKHFSLVFWLFFPFAWNWNFFFHFLKTNVWFQNLKFELYYCVEMWIFCNLNFINVSWNLSYLWIWLFLIHFNELRRFLKILKLLCSPTRGQFHKPIYTLRQALTLSAKLLRHKKASQKLGAERKWVYEINPKS